MPCFSLHIKRYLYIRLVRPFDSWQVVHFCESFVLGIITMGCKFSQKPLHKYLHQLHQSRHSIFVTVFPLQKTSNEREIILFLINRTSGEFHLLVYSGHFLPDWNMCVVQDLLIQALMRWSCLLHSRRPGSCSGDSIFPLPRWQSLSS